MSFHFSSRTSWDLRESEFAAAIREVRAAGRPPIDLTLSNPTVCGFNYDAERLLAAVSDARALKYAPDARGMFSAREAVARYYADHGAAIDPGAILLTTSTSEGYSYLFRLLCDAGDEVLVAQPSYPLFDFLGDLDDVRLRHYPLFYDHGWWIDFAELERRISPRTRAILVVHPNNPTGHWTGRSERGRIEELCVRHGLALIVDEVFLDYALAPGGRAESFAVGPHPALTFVLSGLSKIAGLPQMKVAWLAALGPEPGCADSLGRLEAIADTFLSMSAPVQVALPTWLAGREAIQRQILARARTNLAMAISLSEEEGSGISVLRTEAGWSAVLALASCVGEDACAERLVRERGVVVHPGAFYGMAEAGRVVVSLIGASDEFELGLRRISG